MHGPMLQGSVHNSWKLKTSQFLNGQISIKFESLKLMLKSEKDGVTIIKPGRLARQITWLEPLDLFANALLQHL